MRRVLTWVFAVCIAGAGLILAAPEAVAGDAPCVSGLAPPDTSYRNLTGLDCHGADAPANITTTIGTNVNNTALFRSGPDDTVVGTGVIDPFVRIQNDGGDKANCVQPCLESGYNTEGQEQFETKDAGAHNWTHAIRLSQVGLDAGYRVFILDINEANNKDDRYLSLDKLQVYLGSDPSITGFVESNPDCQPGGPCGPAAQGFATSAANPVPNVWDMDGFGQDVSIGLNYNLNHGSGKGIDLTVRIPDAVFQAAILANPNLIDNPYVYLYSSFGATGLLSSDKTNNCNQYTGNGPPPVGCPAGILPPGDYGQSAGFEEWSTLKGVPEPMSVALLLIGLAAIGFVRRQQPSPIAC